MLVLPKVAIIELGSQYTLLIERSLRELGVRSIILDPQRAGSWLRQNSVKAIILSGGVASVYDLGAPQPPEEIFSSVQEDGRPVSILGICYGMQWLAQRLGGEVKSSNEAREFGEAWIEIFHPAGLFAGLPSHQLVWMSHGDSVSTVPPEFDILGRTDSGAIGVMSKGHICGVQFHPEVTHTLHGKEILKNFLFLARCVSDWKPASIVTSIQEDVIAKLGGHKAIFGFSGGVDSTTVSAILSPALKDRLLAITIDGGNLRHGELEEIEQHAAAAGVKWKVIEARSEFQNVLHDITDAEKKRRLFKRVYTSILIQEAQVFGAKFVIQGTLAPDRIESGGTGGAVIKSHHNVGLDMGDLLQLHPIDTLFKYEVRSLAKEVGLPESVWNRQPFPGPGLFLRVVGVPATSGNLEIVRWADARVKEVLNSHQLYDQISQLVVAYVGVKTVGVKGDGRVYGGAIVVRAVATTDFMSAEGVWFPKQTVQAIKKALAPHPEIVRIWFDPTDKPPATTEME